MGEGGCAGILAGDTQGGAVTVNRPRETVPTNLDSVTVERSMMEDSAGSQIEEQLLGSEWRMMEDRSWMKERREKQIPSASNATAGLPPTVT